MTREEQSSPLSRPAHALDWHGLIQNQGFLAAIGRDRSSVGGEFLDQAIAAELPFPSLGPFMAVPNARACDVSRVFLKSGAVVAVFSKMGGLQEKRSSAVRFIEPTSSQNVSDGSGTVVYETADGRGSDDIAIRVQERPGKVATPWPAYDRGE